MVIDVPADDVWGLPEFWGCLGLVGGRERAEQPVVGLGAEDGELDAVGGQDVPVGVLDPVDEAGEAEPARVVGHLARGVVTVRQPGDRGAGALAGDPGRCGEGGGERAGQGGDPRIAGARRRGPRPVAGD